MQGGGSLPQYYKSSKGRYRPASVTETETSLLDVILSFRRRTLKRLHMRSRSLGLTQKTALLLVMLCVAGFVLFSGSTKSLSSPNPTLAPVDSLLRTAEPRSDEAENKLRMIILGDADDERPTAAPVTKERPGNDASNRRPPEPSWSAPHKRLLDRLGLQGLKPGGSAEQGDEDEQLVGTPLAELRRQRIKEAFVHAYGGYEKHAFGHDEVRPVTNETNDSWNGWGVTMIDALDTMALMGLTEELARARAHVATLTFDQDKSISVFETTIRYLGGLLSAYALTQDQLYADKAFELGRAMLPAFETETRIPYNSLNLQTGKASNPKWTQGRSILAEAGSLQLEFKYLSYISGDPVFAEISDDIMRVFRESSPPVKGLYPVTIDPQTGTYGPNDVSFGALADSFYEYELKQYIQTSFEEPEFRDMYIESVESMKEHLIRRSGSVTYIGNLESSKFKPVMDHLVCFVPGMLALGSNVLERPDDLALARELAETCVMLYDEQPTGIAPEIVSFQGSPDAKYRIVSPKYYLRPETIESLFVLYRVTGDEQYRERAWRIFESIERHCKTDTAYSGLNDVTKVPAPLNNSMQSFFLAETLKYLYLIFSPDTVLPLHEWVLNTEAHPLPIFSPRR